MTAKGTYTFDADTAQFNGKVDAMSRRSKGVSDAFSAGAKALEGMVSPLGLVATASAGVLAIWNDIVKTQKESAGKLKAAQPARLRVLSRAKSGADVGRIAGAIDATKLQTGASDDQAAALQEQLEGSGLQSFRRQFAGLRDLGADPAAIANSMGNIQDAFGPLEDVPGMLDRIGKASRDSDATMEAFTAAVAQAAPAAKTAGVSLNEVIAILSQVGGKEIPQLASGLEQLSKIAVKTGSKDGFLGMVDKLGNLNARQLQGRLGAKNMDAVWAVQQINTRRDAIRGALADQNNAAGFLDRQSQTLYSSDAASTLTRNAALAQAQKEESERRGGMAELSAQERQAQLAREYGWFGRNLPNVAEGWSRMTGGPVAINAPLADGSAGRKAYDGEQERRLMEENNDLLRQNVAPTRFRGEREAHPEIDKDRP